MSIANNNVPVAENIALVIDKKGLKRRSVAEKAGYTDQMFTDMLNGRKVIKASDISNLTVTLGVTPNDLFGIPNRTPPKKR